MGKKFPQASNFALVISLARLILVSEGKPAKHLAKLHSKILNNWGNELSRRLHLFRYLIYCHLKTSVLTSQQDANPSRRCQWLTIGYQYSRYSGIPFIEIERKWPQLARITRGNEVLRNSFRKLNHMYIESHLVIIARRKNYAE